MDIEAKMEIKIYLLEIRKIVKYSADAEYEVLRGKYLRAAYLCGARDPHGTAKVLKEIHQLLKKELKN